MKREYWIERRHSLGHPADPLNFRPEVEKDRARIIHSAAFRRLQGKTQVLGIGETDFHRTRLTHSLEVAQIARGIVLQLQGNPNQTSRIVNELEVPVIEAICLAHDLGHPPFGHRGELALDFLMRDGEDAGFEANAQTFRLLCHDEMHTWDYGLNPTRRVLLGVLKYPVSRAALQPPDPVTNGPDTVRNLSPTNWKATKCYYDKDFKAFNWVVERFTENDRARLGEIELQGPGRPSKTVNKSLDASIMDTADDIAYAVHDLEDMAELKLITEGQFDQHVVGAVKAWSKTAYIGSQERPMQDALRYLFLKERQTFNRKLATGALVRRLVESVRIRPVEGFDEEAFSYRAELDSGAAAVRDSLKQLVEQEVIQQPSVQTVEYGGQQIVAGLFEAINSDPKSLIPEKWTWDWDKHAGPHNAQRRVVCSYIAGMTDSFAHRIYERLYAPRHRSVFERI